MAERGAALVVDLDAADFDTQFNRQLTRLLIDADLRRKLAAASAALCDGQGAARTATAFLQRIRDHAG
jgi:spore coat polysaccharide biosynthesis predicted glycosyltransferase SpsG